MHVFERDINLILNDTFDAYIIFRIVTQYLISVRQSIIPIPVGREKCAVCSWRRSLFFIFHFSSYVDLFPTDRTDRN